MVLDIATIWHSDYQPSNWHLYLVYVAITWIAVAGNILAASYIPAFNKALFVVAVVTLSSTMITLFVVGRQNHASADFIFTDTENRTGWSSDGWAFMLAVSNAVYSFLGSDCAAHLCEEIANPAKMVPRVILWPLALGLLTAFPFAASLMYSITNVDAVLSGNTGLPLIEIYHQGTGSRVAASILLAFFAFCFFGNLVANGMRILTLP
jgi:choline transport protein